MPKTSQQGQILTQCWFWNDGNINWSNNPYTWGDVCLVQKIIGGAPEFRNNPWENSYKKLKKEEKKRFITLVNKCLGKDYKITKEVKDVKLSSKDIELTVKEVLKPTIKIQIK